MKRYEITLVNGETEYVDAVHFGTWPRQGVCFLGWDRNYPELPGTVDSSDIVIFYPFERLHRIRQVTLLAEIEIEPEVRRQTAKAIEKLAKTSLREYYEVNR